MGGPSRVADEAPASWLAAPPPRVLTVGVHILDVLGRPVDSLPPGQGSVPLEEIRLTAAGTAAGTAVDLAKLGAQVSSVGCIGDDAAGRLVVELLAGHGVDVSHVAVVAGVMTTLDLLRPGEVQSLERVAPLLALADYFLPKRPAPRTHGNA